MRPRWISLLMAAGMLASAVLAAVAEPPAKDETSFETLMEDLKRSSELQLDALYAASGPMRYQPETIAFYIGADARFAEFSDRMAVYYLADPKVRAEYAANVAKGRFEGSAEDYARHLTAMWLNEPRYGYYAQIHSPPNIANGQALLEFWLAADSGGPMAEEAPCTNEWAKRKPIADLAVDFERATNTYLDWARADKSVWAAFNPGNVQFIDAAGEADFMRRAVANWLVQGDETLLQRSSCMKYFSNFDAWARWEEETGGWREPFSGRSAPEEVKGGAVPPATYSGD